MSKKTNNSRMKIISPTIHGIIDYAVVVFLLLSHSLFGPFTVPFAIAIGALAVIHLALTVCTRFPAGLFGIVSFRIHGLIELLVSIALVVSPWLIGFSDQSVIRNLVIALGVAIFVVWFLTDYVPPSSRVKKSSNESGAANNQGNQ